MTENKLPRKPNRLPQNGTPPSGSPRNRIPSKTASSSGTPPNKGNAKSPPKKGKANVQGYTNNRLALASQKKV
jgi:hypothetical protein